MMALTPLVEGCVVLAGFTDPMGAMIETNYSPLNVMKQ